MGGLRSLAAALLSAACGLSHAQTTTVAPSAPQRCLTRGDVLLGVPVYPENAFEFRMGARVTVELEFTGNDTAPRVHRVKVDKVDRFADDFERAVRDFVAGYRVPCLPSGETAKLLQEFVFVPHDGRSVALWSAPDAGSERRAQLAKCIRHERPGTVPDYPRDLQRTELQGTVMLRLGFADASSAPTIEVLDDGGHSSFEHEASRFAARYRMPCHDAAGPVNVVQTYVFRMQDGARLVLKDLTFASLIRRFKGITQAQVYFDFRTMGCPFDLRFGPRMPVLPNEVGEIGGADPERRFFLDWLSRQQLDLPKPQLNALLHQSAVVTVPCMVIKLGPASGGGASK